MAWQHRSHVGSGPLANVEMRWLREYATWSAPIDRAIRTRTDISPLRCSDEAAHRVGEAPSQRLAPVAREFLGACRSLAAETVSARRTQPWFVARHTLDDALTMNLPLPTRTGQTDVSRIEPRLSRLATLVAGRSTQVRCWSVGGWLHVAGEWRVLAPDVPEFWPLGIADKVRRRTQLAPVVCASLEASLAHGPPGGTSNERYVLTVALMIFAHEAEHHRNPRAAEAVVECYAIQDVRRVARLFNGTKAFVNEAPLLARDVAYPSQSASYRTHACRAGGPLDRTPGDGRWP